jgi:ABC-type transport system substrate-binding protein
LEKQVARIEKFLAEHEGNLEKCAQGQLDAYIPDTHCRARDLRFATQDRHKPPTDEKFTMQAVNYAINREDLIRYATRGNGVVVPTLLPEQAFGYDPDLAPYPFEPGTAQQLLRQAGYPPGRPLILIATEDLEVQATVVSKMLEQVGLTVELQMLDAATYTARPTWAVSHTEPRRAGDARR